MKKYILILITFFSFSSLFADCEGISYVLKTKVYLYSGETKTAYVHYTPDEFSQNLINLHNEDLGILQNAIYMDQMFMYDSLYYSEEIYDAHGIKYTVQNTIAKSDIGLIALESFAYENAHLSADVPDITPTQQKLLKDGELVFKSSFELEMETFHVLNFDPNTTQEEVNQIIEDEAHDFHAIERLASNPKIIIVSTYSPCGC